MSTQPKLPMQPVHIASDGVVRFVENALVRKLLDESHARAFGLNELAASGIGSNAEWMQLAQLIGYSISGYSELSYVTDLAYAIARRRADKLTTTEVRDG